jgi:tetraacyldisaccharide 4'-kinase
VSGPLPPALAPLTIPLSWLYRGVIDARNRRYDRPRHVHRVDRPVISVGNITVGGSGKTPIVRYFASLLVESGHRPVIAMRGYKARPGEPSDEEAEYAETLEGIEVVANPDRVAALRASLSDHPEIDCVLLDDGFQHRRLHRDLDLVLVDASRPNLDGRVLPAGFLREPPTSLRRADAVIVTRAKARDSQLAAEIERLHGRPPLAWSRHRWRGLRRYDRSDPSGMIPIDWLTGKRIAALLGVAHPPAVLEQLRECGAEIAVSLPARDHERYTAGKLEKARRAASDCEALVVTGKDWVKARQVIDFDRWTVPVLVPDLTIEVFEGADAVRDLVLGTVAHDGGRRP